MPNYKIYFCGSIRGGRADVDLYGLIIDKLKKYGTVLTPDVGDKKITHLGESEGGLQTDKEIHDRDVQLINECHAIVAEVTQPSLGVGYEIGRGVELNKKILCLYRPQTDKKLSAMIRGAEKPGQVVVKDYKEEEISGVLEEFFVNVVPKNRKDSIDWKNYEPM